MSRAGWFGVCSGELGINKRHAIKYCQGVPLYRFRLPERYVLGTHCVFRVFIRTASCVGRYGKNSIDT